MDNLNNVRCEAADISGIKKREYLKDKINELAMNSKKKNIRDLYRGINGFKRGYQPRNNVKDSPVAEITNLTNLTIYQRGPYYFGIKLYNHLPSSIK
jgi:hypothetical protein